MGSPYGHFEARDCSEYYWLDQQRNKVLQRIKARRKRLSKKEQLAADVLKTSGRNEELKAALETLRRFND